MSLECLQDVPAASLGIRMLAGMQHEWRCTGYGALLGIVRGLTLFLRHKGQPYVVEAPRSTTATCRRCGAMNVWHGGREAIEQRAGT